MLNNKGFAISTVLYSLLLIGTLVLFLLIGSLSFERTSTNDFVANIKEEFIELESRNKVETTFNYTGSSQTYIAPITTTYTLEVWGASGGSINGYTGGAGGYSSGQVELNAGDTLYVYVGGAGIGASTRGETLTGGYNGGGSVTGNSDVNHITASGGGATHIARTDGLLYTLESDKDQILIVAGGGGGARNQENHIAAARWGNGGSGGGTTGGGAFSNYATTNTPWEITENVATQTTGYAFGQGADATGQSAGGGGYYGGYSGSSPLYTGSGYGGSGFVGNVLNGHTVNGVQLGNGYAKISYYTE